MKLKDYVFRVLLTGVCGGFATLLAEAWCVADSTNKAKLESAFPDIFRTIE